MTIDKLGPVDPISNFNKTGKSVKSVKNEQNDSISISEDAKTMAEVYRTAEELKKIPDIRQDRIDEVKKKLEDPNYINDSVIDSVADSVLSVFGLE